MCATLVAGGAAGSAPAQPSADVSWRTLRDAELSLGWLRSENAAGLLFFRDSSLSEIAAYAAAEQGDLKTIATPKSASPSDWTPPRITGFRSESSCAARWNTNGSWAAG